jgi:SAM-dependent methyltransferase
MDERIGPTGCWLLKDEPHVHDKALADQIIALCKKRNIEWILDLGCGNGQYGKWFWEAGLHVLEFDGNPHTPEIVRNGMVVDLAKPVTFLEGLFDFVLSLEVGEHIPREYEQVFLDNVVRHAGRSVLLSWAVEGQPGLGHVNCRNNDYIIEQMRVRGFKFMPIGTFVLRDKATLPWFKDTLMLFKKVSI